MSKLGGLVLLFALGILLGAVGHAYLTLPDPRSQAAHDRAIARAHVLEVARETIQVRGRALRVYVTDTLPGRVDTQTITIREALPDSLRPALDSLNAMWSGALNRAMAQAEAWRVQDSATAVELDSALAREARLLQQHKASPMAIVVGVAATPRGLQPAITVGVRVPLPRLF